MCELYYEEGNLHSLNLNQNRFNKFPMVAIKNLQGLKTLSLGKDAESRKVEGSIQRLTHEVYSNMYCRLGFVICLLVLHCTVLYCTLLYCTVLYCTLLYCTVLYCNVLYCTVLYSTVLYWDIMYKIITN